MYYTKVILKNKNINPLPCQSSPLSWRVYQYLFEEGSKPLKQKGNYVK
jgi:hypothetical protein